MKRKYAAAAAGVLGLVALCLTGSPVSVKAQDIGPVFDMGSLTNTLSMSGVTESEKARARKMEGKRAPSSRRPTSRAVASDLGTFTPSAAVRKRSLDSFVAHVRQKDPANAAAVEKAFTSPDIFGVASKWMARYGLKTNNVADVMAVYLTSSWLGARGSDADPTKAQILAVRTQAARALAGTPAVTKATDARKQELADSLLLQTALISYSVQAAKKKPEAMPTVKAAIARGVRTSFHLDLNSLKLTDQGLRL